MTWPLASRQSIRTRSPVPARQTSSPLPGWTPPAPRGAESGRHGVVPGRARLHPDPSRRPRDRDRQRPRPVRPADEHALPLRRPRLLGRGHDLRVLRGAPGRRPYEPRRGPRGASRRLGRGPRVLRRHRRHRSHRPARPRRGEPARAPPGRGDAGEAGRPPHAHGPALRGGHRRPQLPGGDRHLRVRARRAEARGGHRRRGGPPQHPGGDRGRGAGLLRDGEPGAGLLPGRSSRVSPSPWAPSSPGCCSAAW